MKSISAIPALFCAGLATAAAAQDGFYTNGYAELGYYSQGSNDNTLGYANATIGYTDAASGFGAEFGLDAAITDTDRYSALYGALTYQSSFGKLSFGAPRAAIDAYLAYVPTLGGNTLYDIGPIGRIKHSNMTDNYLFSDNKTPIGLRYDGTFGNTNVGASYHRYADTDIYNLAANMQFGQTTVTGAVEHLKSNTQSESRYFLGVETKFGQVTAGLLYGQNAFIGSGNAVEVYAKYKPMDQLELSATALNIGSGSDTAYGLAADYTFSQGLYLKAGVADSFSSSSDAAVNVAVGLRF